MPGANSHEPREAARAIVVGQAACRGLPLAALRRMDFDCLEVEDPYEAMAQLCRRPQFFTALVLSLNSLYREELQIIGSVKRRFPHVEIWLSDTDGRQSALAEAVRLGADGLIAGDGLHRIGGSGAVATESAIPAPPSPPPERPETAAPPPPVVAEPPAVAERSNDPLLTAEELRALLQESPGNPG